MEKTELYRLVREQIPEAFRHYDQVCSEVVRYDFGHCPKPSGAHYAWRYPQASRGKERLCGRSRRLVNLVSSSEGDAPI